MAGIVAALWFSLAYLCSSFEKTYCFPQAVTIFVAAGISKFVSAQCGLTFAAGDYFNGPCISLTISKLLGYLVVLGAIVVKVPQILKFVKAKSSTGVRYVIQIRNCSF